VIGQSTLSVLVVLAAAATAVQPPSAENIERGSLPVSWITGASCPETPAFRIHEYNPDLFILRQSGCTNFEKPFLYLMLGSKEALLIDTGAAGASVAPVIEELLRRDSQRRQTPQ